MTHSDRTRLRRIGLPALALGAFVATWYLVHGVVLSPRRRFIVPAPHDVIRVAFLDGVNRGELLTGLGNTARVALIGFAIATLVAFAAATVMAANRLVERALFPYALALQTIPVLALVPLFSVWWGPTRTSRVVTCVLVSVFPLLTNFLFGLKSTDPELRNLFRVNGAGRRTTFLKLTLPSAMPAAFTGLRIGAGLCVIGSLVADFFFTRGDLGLGRLLNNYAKELEYERLFGGVILASLLGIVIYVVIGWLGRRTLRHWHSSETVD